jgi:hypothetical protein
MKPPHTTQLRVVERFKLINDGKELEVNFTVDDPGTFNAAWSAYGTESEPDRSSCKNNLARRLPAG